MIVRLTSGSPKPRNHVLPGLRDNSFEQENMRNHQFSPMNNVSLQNKASNIIKFQHLPLTRSTSSNAKAKYPVSELDLNE